MMLEGEVAGGVRERNFRSEFERQAKILALFLLFTADGPRSGY